MGRVLVSLLILFASVGALPAFADITIAVIGKTKNDTFYEQTFAGCEEFSNRQNDLTCIYDGPIDYQDTRSQVYVVEKVLKQNVDGILISTTNSDFLVDSVLKRAKEQGVKVMTFDSDLLDQHHDYRIAYVGTNNFDFGVALGDYAKRFKKDGETQICIQSGSDSTPNLNERIRGVRFALSGNDSNQKLTGENGWVEYVRCPFYSLGKRDRAVHQLKHLLSRKEAPIFLAVAGFAQFSPNYIQTMLPYRDQIKSGELVIISADAEKVQLQALEQNLSTINIGQRPFEMGRYGAELLYDVIKHNKMPEKEINYLGFFYCREDNGVDCRTD
ncbi:substrate-binding domain-containing protein [Terasakiella sp. A23]|uniref:substrate-binding domain-containing protein n=1 Tax=Terasakiella sp. FCG-A23 TaxID=3080561 RepID=UPI002953D759|nr:substrate-binding domain-containing protein [Terasakiella sp. A23]MDV7340124.1 substrate-binding domain-containing protein [Terasakiella sp. A23]